MSGFEMWGNSLNFKLNEYFASESLLEAYCILIRRKEERIIQRSLAQRFRDQKGEKPVTFCHRETTKGKKPSE